MGIRNRNSIVANSIYHSDSNELIANIDNQKINFKKNVHSTSTITSDKLYANEINSYSNDYIIWNNPTIRVNGDLKTISTQSVGPVNISDCKLWIDIDRTDCWDRSSYYITELINGRRWYGLDHATIPNSLKRSHFVNTQPDTKKYVIRTDSNGGGSLYLFENRPELDFGQNPHTFIFFVYNSQSNSQSGWLLCQNSSTTESGNSIGYWADDNNWRIYSEYNSSYYNVAASATFSPISGGWQMLAFASDNLNTEIRLTIFNKYFPYGVTGTAVGVTRAYYNGRKGYGAISIGNNFNTTNTWGAAAPAYIGPILAYNKLLSTNEISSIYDYYKADFGL
jgi:hypothetical protein